MNPLKIADPARFDLQLGSLSDELRWNVTGLDWVYAQLFQGNGTSWASGAVVTAEISVDGVNWSGFPTAVTWSGFTQNDRIRVTGARYFRLRTSTAGSGTATAIPALSGAVDPS